MKNKKTIYEEIAEAKEARKTMIEDIRSKLAEADAKKKAAEAKEAEALVTNDAESYTAAKEEKRKAEDEIEFYKIQIADAEANPLYTHDELEKKIKAVDEYFRTSSESGLKELLTLLNKAHSLAKSIHEEAVKGATTIDDIRGIHRGYGINGNTIATSVLENRIAIALDNELLKPYKN